MPVSPVSQSINTHTQKLPTTVSPGNSSPFANLLQNQQTKTGTDQSHTRQIASPPSSKPAAGKNNYFPLGKISDQTPTVSQILQKNPQFKGTYWQIINSDLNKGKSFTAMQKGALLSINQETKELFWENPAPPKKLSRIERIQSYLRGMLKDESANVLLGTLDKNNPTISHVVRNNENIKGFHWDIIHAKINKDKPYATIPQGTIISINPKTLELIFKKPIQQIKQSIPAIEKTVVASAAQKLSRTDILKLKLQDIAQDSTKPVLLGTLSSDLPTVSQIVRKNEHTKSTYKEIVYSDTNKNKAYHTLQEGTKICIDPVTLELIFEKPLIGIDNKTAANSCQPKADIHLTKSERLQQYVAGLETGPDKLITIGTLNKNLPTVSQLLNHDQRFTGNHWGIIFSESNRDKPFKTLLPGTEVSLNPKNLELLFKAPTSQAKNIQTFLRHEPPSPPKAVPAKTEILQQSVTTDTQISQPQPDKPAEIINHEKTSASKPAEVEAKAESTASLMSPHETPVRQPTPKDSKAQLFNNNLALSAKEVIGRPSNEIDNYKIVLKGLQSQGIEYEGVKGLKENLGQLASLMWMDQSSLQNMDGILKVAGETVYSKTLSQHASKEQLTNVTNHMAQFLESGQILTLSSPSIDQSGVVANRQDEWTIINSNTLANEISYHSSGDAKIIGEETITKRITELHTKAALNNEPLTVTLSNLDEDILRNVDKLVDIQKSKMGLSRKFQKPQDVTSW